VLVVVLVLAGIAEDRRRHRAGRRSEEEQA
jgi:hypothetical protein